jgi:hypothetical protein
VGRIVERQLHGKDASEADVAVLDWQNEHWESVETEEQWTVIEVETAYVDLDELGRRIAALKD